ncbi:hypothetical protein [Phyllobacterium leguminum]|uniref:Uncharacterized protein n=1 Tax=Phyllobacterium leguminum TaxID=314237 RepID=A0A318SXV7_9HYPH|nr:hypothetical protein [Phyllobacterium leguminum]PYE86882.1 hypothetical protein C7477_11820 [Phyllobacterium leguminum]
MMDDDELEQERRRERRFRLLILLLLALNIASFIYTLWTALRTVTAHG